MRKIYIVPNIVTTANMLCGFFSVVSSIHRDFVVASWAIMAAIIFDVLDGRIARLARATSRFGVEYDSLSDLISFGLAPAILLYLWALDPLGRIGLVIAFLFLVCGALRLARFNIMTEVAPKGVFMGLPIPGAAGMAATLVIFSNAIALVLSDVTLAVFAAGLSFLMISTIPFPSFKEVNWRSRASFKYFLVGIAAMIAILYRPEVMLFFVISAYIVFSLVWNLIRLIRKKNTPSN